MDSKSIGCEQNPLVPEKSLVEPTQELYVFTPGPKDGTYFIKGSTYSEYNTGDDLVVYGEITPGTEVASALLKVISRNPDSLTAQVILIYPGFSIRPPLRVDGKVEFLAKMIHLPMYHRH